MIHSILRWLNAPLYKIDRNSELFVDPTFGDCRYVSEINAWSAHWQYSEDRQIRIMGRSRRPLPEQVALWHQFQEMCPKLIREANASIPEPQVEKKFTPAEIKREGVELSQVRFESDGTVHLFLDFTIKDSHGYELCPQLIFKNWQLVSAVWCV